jgi:hypothetical protein
MTRRRIMLAVLAATVVTAGILVVMQRGNATAPKPAPSSKPAKARPTAANPAAGTKPVAATSPAKSANPADAVKPANETKSASDVKPSTVTKAAEVTTPANGTKPVNATKSTETQAAKTETAVTNKAPTETSKADVKASAPAPASTATTPPAPVSTVQETLKQNTSLAAKVASRLPAGTDLMDASAGFLDLGQFVAAVNVSNNLGLSFADLKTQLMTGKKSLGEAIPAVRKVASGTIEAQRAEYEARGMISESERQQSLKTTTTPPTTKSKPKTK